MITVLTGPNSHGLQKRLREIVAAFQVQHGDSIERFDASELTSTDPVIDAVRSVSFLEPRKLVIVRDFGQHPGLIDSTTLEQLVSQTADTTDLLLVDPKLDRRTTGYKYLQKSVGIEVFAELSSRDLAIWAKEYTAGLGGQITMSDAHYLVDRVGINQQHIQQEIKKLVLFAPDVTRSSIESLTDQTPQGRVFAMLEELFLGNHAKAWRLYLDQRAQGEEPYKIMAMITWQLQQLTVVVFSPSKDHGTLTAAGISPYSAQKLVGLARRIDAQQLRSYIDDLAQIDLQSKTSADVESALAVYFSVVSVTS